MPVPVTAQIPMTLDLLDVAITLGTAFSPDWTVLSRMTFAPVSARAAETFASLCRAVIIGPVALRATGVTLRAFAWRQRGDVLPLRGDSDGVTSVIS